MHNIHNPGEPLFCKPSGFDIWMEREGQAILENILNYPSDRCYCCNTKRKITVHHIIPLHVGGLNLKSNKAHVCEPCHDDIHHKNKDQRDDKSWILMILKIRKKKQFSVNLKGLESP